MKLALALLCLVFVMPLVAQDAALNWDIDSIFDAPLTEPEVQPGEDWDVPGFTVLDLIRQPGFRFDGTFEFLMGVVPGWREVPWYTTDTTLEDGGKNYTWGYVGRMRINFDLDIQLSNMLGIRSNVFFTVPGLDIELGEFFFDYNLYDKAFFRGGRFNYGWGISPNFTFANLLARVPAVYDTTAEGGIVSRYGRDPFILRLDIPIGVGGFQLLTLTRVNLLEENETVRPKDFGYGAKYNYATRVVDIDVGTFYQEAMPLRGFASIKTTVVNTELYNEWLGVLNMDHFIQNPDEKITANDFSGAVSLGFVHDFFRGRFTVNGEVFYNWEKNAFWYRPETSFTEAATLDFSYELNFSLNLLYRFRAKGSPRAFIRTLYAPFQDSAQVVPGFRLTPVEHLEFYFAVPMALGSRDGYYYHNTADPKNQNRPFAVVMLLSLTGNIRIVQHQ